MDRSLFLAKLRDHIAMCRNLAASTGDERTAAALRAMADEGERELKALNSRRDARIT